MQMQNQSQNQAQIDKETAFKEMCKKLWAKHLLVQREHGTDVALATLIGAVLQAAEKRYPSDSLEANFDFAVHVVFSELYRLATQKIPGAEQ